MWKKIFWYFLYCHIENIFIELELHLYGNVIYLLYWPIKMNESFARNLLSLWSRFCVLFKYEIYVYFAYINSVHY